MTTEDKLDRIVETTSDTRMAVATLAGEMRTAMLRLDVGDQGRADHEARLRTLERRLYALPSLGAICGVGGLVAALWDKIT